MLVLHVCVLVPTLSGVTTIWTGREVAPQLFDREISDRMANYSIQCQYSFPIFHDDRHREVCEGQWRGGEGRGGEGRGGEGREGEGRGGEGREGRGGEGGREGGRGGREGGGEGGREGGREGREGGRGGREGGEGRGGRKKEREGGKEGGWKGKGKRVTYANFAVRG